jgi:hypothetical protein
LGSLTVRRSSWNYFITSASTIGAPGECAFSSPSLIYPKVNGHMKPKHPNQAVTMSAIDQRWTGYRLFQRPQGASLRDPSLTPLLQPINLSPSTQSP